MAFDLIVLLGILLGSINGLLVVVAKIEPFIVTLATWSVFDGIALIVLPTPGGTTPAGLTNWAEGTGGLVPSPILVLVLFLALWWWARSTSLFPQDLQHRQRCGPRTPERRSSRPCPFPCLRDRGAARGDRGILYGVLNGLG